MRRTARYVAESHPAATKLSMVHFFLDSAFEQQKAKAGRRVAFIAFPCHSQFPRATHLMS